MDEDSEAIGITDPSEENPDVKPSITGIMVELERLRGVDKLSYNSMKSIALLLATHERDLKEFRELKANLKGGTKVVLMIGGIVSFCLTVLAALWSGRFTR